ncbi:MAG TPA: DUF1569 domain-containing protein [Flavipsychrobacter sp.]|nr:DUF1569 domain-containing protein [Flavipsychrobacter sp.]
MMQSLFTTEGKQSILDRIQRLTPQSQKQWGKMNVAQMLAHCQKPLEAALNIELIPTDLKMKMLSFLFGKMVKNQYLSGAELKKNSPTAPTFVITDERDFEKEKEILIKDINAFSEKGRAGKLGNRHPFFGKMTHEEWDALQWKHLDHHLKQFGV